MNGTKILVRVIDFFNSNTGTEFTWVPATIVRECKKWYVIEATEESEGLLPMLKVGKEPGQYWKLA